MSKIKQYIEDEYDDDIEQIIQEMEAEDDGE